MNFAFDATLRLGDVITIAAFLGIGISAYYNIKGRLDIGSITMENLAAKIDMLEETIKLNSSTLQLVAIQKVEIDHIKQDIYELKHGEGVLSLKQKG